MKRFMVILVIAVFCLTGVPAFADFKMKVQREVQKEIGAFFQRNGGYVDKKGVYQHGSRITIDNMDGLMLHLNQIFNENIVIPKPVPKPDAPTDEKADE